MGLAFHTFWFSGLMSGSAPFSIQRTVFIPRISYLIILWVRNLIVRLPALECGFSAYLKQTLEQKNHILIKRIFWFRGGFRLLKDGI